MANDMDNIVEVNVDEDILKFLRGVYFGELSDPIGSASTRAYLDMNRTIRFNELPENDRYELRKEVKTIFESEIKNLNSINIVSQMSFDSWHRNVSDIIKNIYKDKGIELTYGHTQKWINMTIKYLYMLEVNSFADIFKYLHVPIDNYVLDIARDKLEIEKPKAPWSRWNDYDEYLTYQNCIREKITGNTPLRWEFRSWLNAKNKI